MKQTKKLLAMILTLMMIMAMQIGVLAQQPTTDATTTTEFTITSNDANHTYEIYQIFTGDLHEGALSNVKWGVNGKNPVGTAVDTDVLTELSGKTTASDAEKLAVINKYVNLNSEAHKTITGAGSVNVVPGYYYIIDKAGSLIIRDKDDSLTEIDEAYTTAIVKVANNVEIEAKSAKPEVDKQVWDETDDAEAGHTNGWGESADHAINETFQFKLVATLPNDTNFDSYAHYQVKFTDQMSAGVTFENIESVKVNGEEIAATAYEMSEITTTNATGIQTWSLTVYDLKAHITDLKGATVEVIYNAHLNEAAIIGYEATGGRNKNTVGLKYSNNPSWEGPGPDNNGDGRPDTSNTPEYGKTPEDTVWVFTYIMDNTKVDGEGNALAGAGFRLYADEATTQEIALIYDATLNAYRPIKGQEAGVEMTSAETTGKFDIKGLDAGTYYLKETTTPAGYNTAPVTKVVINAVHAENEGKTDATDTITYTQDEKAVEAIKIVNTKGLVLPETGGMGTTIFYIIGGLLMAGAVVLFITKKRMSKYED